MSKGESTIRTQSEMQDFGKRTAFLLQGEEFYIGDKVVSTITSNEQWTNLVCVIDAVHKDMVITHSGNLIIHHREFRRATEEEIESGYKSYNTQVSQRYHKAL